MSALKKDGDGEILQRQSSLMNKARIALANQKKQKQGCAEDLKE